MAARDEGPTVIIGAGMAGLAAGRSSGAPVYEAARSPGGICSSYYLRPGTIERLTEPPADGEAYRFELGGGHWIFGGDPDLLALVDELSPLRRYEQWASAIVDDPTSRVPYPIQHHLHALGPLLAERALAEITDGARTRARRPPDELPTGTLAEWLVESFGPTLAGAFFLPFNRRSTDGLIDSIAPQDGYTSPIDLAAISRGARPPRPHLVGGAVTDSSQPTFVYPEHGLDHMARRLAEDVEVNYDAEVVAIDVDRRILSLADGREVPYGSIISTVPLDRAVELTGRRLAQPPDPHTSMLVLNIGAVRGDRCPDEHWVYEAASVAGFHRVGFYDNVDPSFLPRSHRPGGAGVAGDRRPRAALYVERACQSDNRPKPAQLARFMDEVVIELQARRWIGATDVIDPTWIDVAGTWTWPGSTWREEALHALSGLGIHQIGRRGRWTFQTIADSLRDGRAAGRVLSRR